MLASLIDMKDPSNSAQPHPQRSRKADSLQSRSYKFIRKNRAAALGTSDQDGTPHVVIVYCLIESDLSLYFVTRVESRKFKNIAARPIVSMAFYNESSLDTIQLMGKAERIDDLKQEQAILFELIKLRHKEPQWTVPPIEMFERGATNELAIIKVSPSEMTYATFETLNNGRYKPFFQKVI